MKKLIRKAGDEVVRRRYADTDEMLRLLYGSLIRNRLLCEPLFLAHYIERAWTGTLDMIQLCTEAGLPEPEFLNEGERFRQIIWRDWLTESV